MSNIYDHDLPVEIRNRLNYQVLACDTETDGLEFRRDKLRLIQIATKEGDVYLVRNPDFTSYHVRDVLEANTIIFHHAAFDLKFLQWWADIQIHYKSIRCTKTLAKILGYEFSGLGSCLKNILGITLPNKERKIAKSDWNIADLSDEQTLYATGDVIYLHQLHNKLEDQLDWDNTGNYIQAIKTIKGIAELEMKGLTDVLSYEGKPNLNLRRIYQEHINEIRKIVEGDK